MYLKAFIQNLVKIGTVVSEKIQFEFLYVHNIGPRSRNDLDMSLAVIASEKSTAITFSYRKAYVTKFDLAVK